jgi:hypothetical protein
MLCAAPTACSSCFSWPFTKPKPNTSEIEAAHNSEIGFHDVVFLYLVFGV